MYRFGNSKVGKKPKGGKGYAERALDEPRPSTDTRPTIRQSMASSRASFHSLDSQLGEEGIKMTPVPSPQPGQGQMLGDNSLDPNQRPGSAAFSYEEGSLTLNNSDGIPATSNDDKHNSDSTPNKFYGNLIDPLKSVSGKARFKKDYWKSVKVGDFVRIYNEDQIPADIIILATSDPDGACYVETKNLDGETNLKVRQALHSGRKIKHAKDCEQAEFILESGHPDTNLYSYRGVVRWKQRSSGRIFCARR